MQNPEIRVTYLEDGKKRVRTSKENESYFLDLSISETSVKGSITSRKLLPLVRVDLVFPYDFAADDKFFSNGYQAWSTSREYTVTEKCSDVIPIAVTKTLRNMAGISGDTRFVEYPKKAGQFFSHTYTYIKDRNGRLFFIGSLTEKQGFTVIYADMIAGTITVSKDVEGVFLDKEKYDLFDIVLFTGTYDEVFDRYFASMNGRKPMVEHMSGYTSWYNYFQKIDEKIILRDLDALDPVSDAVSIFQIDDGYETFVGDWLDKNKKFPRGMKTIADAIHKKGYMAGIWMAPFNLQRTSKTYKTHPDWVIRDKKGNPLTGVFAWGGAYTMDIYNPEARAYMKHFFEVVLREWGYDMVKLDFLYSQCMYPRNNKSRGTIMCEAMAFLRECCGEDKLILGCGVPLGAAFGYVDACRIGCDVDLVYGGKFYNKLRVNNEIPSAQNSINNAIFRRHLDGRAFCCDPDVFFLRYSNLKFNRTQKILLGGINHLCGDVLFVSDCANEYKAEDWEALRLFFSESSIRILSADYVSEKDLVLRVLKDGKEEEIRFDITTGEGNMGQVLGLPCLGVME